MYKNFTKIITKYLYLILLAVMSVWLVSLVIHSSSVSLSLSLIAFFTVLNILFGIKEVIILDNGIEKRYRFNFILSVICLLVFDPVTTCVSAILASFIYIPINHHKQFGKIHISDFLLNVFSLSTSVSVMALTFLFLGGEPFLPNFPTNVFAILVGAAINFITNITIISLWTKLRGSSLGLFNLISKQFLWLIRYELWQAIYAILVTNTIILYLGNIFQKFNQSKSNIDFADYFVLVGLALVAFVFYYPIEDRLYFFNLLIQFNRQNVDLKILSQKQKENSKKIIRAFITMLEKRDPHTFGHSERVALYSKVIAKKLNLDEENCDKLEMAALLHDIGKMGVDLSIINKNGKLTAEEYNSIKQHPVYGVEILKKIYSQKNSDEDDEFKFICDIANSHHERFDGKGYPRGLCGENISIEARIIAVADSFDAMTSDRPYRSGMPLERAVNEIRLNSGTQFCPKVVHAFMLCINEGTLKISKDDTGISDLLSVFS